jgi:chemotaxis protein CheC
MTDKLDGTSDLDMKENVGPYTWTSGKCMNLGILLELGSIGAGHAATSLSQVLQEPVSIDVPKIHTLPSHLVPKFYAKHDKPTTAIYIQLGGESECDILLLFDLEEAKKIAALMTMAPSPAEVDPALEASAIQELANILIGAFLSAMSDFVGVKLLITPPQQVVDSFDAIIDNFLVKQALVSDVAIIFDTHFKRTSGDASCILMMFPSKEIQNILVEKAKTWLDDDATKVDENKITCTTDTSVDISTAAKSENKVRTEG